MLGLWNKKKDANLSKYGGEFKVSNYFKEIVIKMNIKQWQWRGSDYLNTGQTTNIFVKQLVNGKSLWQVSMTNIKDG